MTPGEYVREIAGGLLFLGLLALLSFLLLNM